MAWRPTMTYSCTGMNFSSKTRRTVASARSAKAASPRARASKSRRRSEPGARNSTVTLWCSSGRGRAPQRARHSTADERAKSLSACATPASRHGRHCQQAVFICKMRMK
eukprot:11985359-Alexandrium_andersonii.AAC.1